MTPDRPLDSAQASLGSVRSRWEHLFAGLTWKGVALVALLCLFNALRQTARLFFGEDDPLVDLLVMLVESFGLSLIVLLLTTLTVVATYNHAPPAPRSRYPALVLAVLVSSPSARRSSELSYRARPWSTSSSKSADRWDGGSWRSGLATPFSAC